MALQATCVRWKEGKTRMPSSVVALVGLVDERAMVPAKVEGVSPWDFVAEVEIEACWTLSMMA